MNKDLIEKIYHKFLSILFKGYKTGEVDKDISWKHSIHHIGGNITYPLIIDILEKDINDISENSVHTLKFCNATWTNDGKNFNSYHYIMDMKNGFFVEWGKTLDNDPEFAPANNILDIEITTKCTGPGNYIEKNITDSGCCPFCYKSNTPNGKNMSFETFKKIIDKMPITLTQIAIGADAHLDQNPDLWDMMDYAKNKGLAVNITCANLDYETAKKVSEKCNAVAVSRYKNKDWCYNTIKLLTDFGMTQVNMHQVIMQENFELVKETINDIKNDNRLEKLNAIVFLSLKTKGRGEKFHPLTEYQFKELIDLCKEKNINWGCDSCSAPKVMKAYRNDPDFEKVFEAVMSCESTLESAYINVDGEYFPCSFTEGTKGWEKGIPVINTKDFIENIWNNEKTKKFRNKLCNNVDENKCRNCPLYNI